MTFLSDISISENGIVAVKNTLEPTIRFKLEGEIEAFTLIYRIRAELFLDKTKLTRLSEAHNNYRGQLSELSWDKPVNKQPFGRNKKRPTFHLEGPLSPLALELIEQKREKHPKGDVELLLKIEVQFFIGTHQIDNETFIDSRTNAPIPFIKLKYNDILFEAHAAVETLPVKISFADWINDFMPVFGMEKTVVYSLPILDLGVVEGDFGQRMMGAMEAFEKMTDARKKADWNNVIKESRPLIELIRDHAFLKNLFTESGFHDDAAQEIVDAIKHLFNFTSKFIHRIPLGGGPVMDSLHAHKEDALFVYTISLNLLNIILAKVRRRGR
ncbi:MAG: hypothetical protein R2824_34815 [Saprospiraceae bacterium]